jgi:hypothetical protein
MSFWRRRSSRVRLSSGSASAEQRAQRARIVVLPGDGVGPEVTAEAVKVLEAAADASQTLTSAPLSLELRFHDIGRAALDASDGATALSASTLEACRAADAILLGAATGSEDAKEALRGALGLDEELQPDRVRNALVDASVVDRRGSAGLLPSALLAGPAAASAGQPQPQPTDGLVSAGSGGDPTILRDRPAGPGGHPAAARRLGPRRLGPRRLGLFGPVHGPVPDLEGRGVANPIGAILSVALLLRHSLGRRDLAAPVERAVEAALWGGRALHPSSRFPSSRFPPVRTADLLRTEDARADAARGLMADPEGGAARPHSTSEVGDIVAALVRQELSGASTAGGSSPAATEGDGDPAAGGSSPAATEGDGDPAAGGSSPADGDPAAAATATVVAMARGARTLEVRGGLRLVLPAAKPRPTGARPGSGTASRGARTLGGGSGRGTAALREGLVRESRPVGGPRASRRGGTDAAPCF